MSDAVEHSVVDPRFHPIHWRFQELFIEYETLKRGDPQELGAWALRVRHTVSEILDPDHEVVEAAKYISHDLRSLEGMRKKQINNQLRGPIRAHAYGVLMAAASAEQEGHRTSLRVVDLHPWVAEPAEPLFEDAHWFMAVTASADNVRAQWRKALGAEGDDLPSAFSPNDPKSGQPRMRFDYYDRDLDKQEWINAHEGAMHYARGCMMRIRNLYKYQPGDQAFSPGLALETLAALSRLARWITDAKVDRAEATTD